MTLVVRDEEDILEANLRYHLAWLGCSTRSARGRPGVTAWSCLGSWLGHSRPSH
jgi:hypothetical protein